MIKTSKYDPIGYISAIDPVTRRPERIVIDHNIKYNESASVDWGVFYGRGTLGGLYTYNYTVERTFPVEFIITDYDGTGTVIENAKELLRKWNQPVVNSNTTAREITAPPPVLNFYYRGFTDSAGTDSPLKVVMKSYSIMSEDEGGWYGTTSTDATPNMIGVRVELAEVGINFRNIK